MATEETPKGSWRVTVRGIQTLIEEGRTDEAIQACVTAADAAARETEEAREAGLVDALAIEIEGLTTYVLSPGDESVYVERAEVFRAIQRGVAEYGSAPSPRTERGDETWYVVGREAAQAAPNALDFSEFITDLWGSPEFLMRDGRIVEAFSPEPEDKNLSRDYAPLIKLLNAQEGR